MLKRLFLWIFIFSSIFWVSFASENAKVENINFSVFSRENCVHCIELKKFLDKNFASGSIVSPKYYSIDEEKNKKIFDEFTSKNSLTKITPIILIWNDIITGYESDETTWKMILDKAKSLEKSSLFETFDSKANAISSWEWCSDDKWCKVPEKQEMLVKIPFVWVVDLSKYSILILSIILGFVDGFNPCAMWVLVMFLSILTQTWSRKKMFQIAWIFILAEAIMYFMILNVWYKTWDFIKLDNIITPIIWVVSLWAWWYFLYEFFTSKDNECKVISANSKKKTIERIKEIAFRPMSIWVFFLTIMIAFSVNIVEFACSIGIPQAYTKLLELSDLSFISKQFYVFIYTLFYMVDDFVVFWVAIYAMHYMHLTTKYTRYCLVLGWVLMLILGYFFLFSPQTLKMIIS